MIVANAKIHFEAFLKQFYTFWSRDVSGECSHMTIQSGSWCTIPSENGLRRVELSIISTNMCERSEKKRNQSESPSVGALDAQSVKWGNRKIDNGFDVDKKVKGIKHNIVVDCNGFILARTACSASVHASHQAHSLCGSVGNEWERLEKILVDRGYRGEIATDIETDCAINLEVSNAPNGTMGFILKLLRWMVERTFSWLDWFRRLSRNYEESTEVAEEMIDLAAIKILLNQI